MARINVEDHKKAIFALNGIPPFEEEMTFYYDESGNCRKFSLTDYWEFQTKKVCNPWGRSCI